MTDATVTLTRAGFTPAAVSGNFALTMAYVSTGTASNWRTTSGTVLFNTATFGVFYKFLGASDTVDVTVSNTATTYDLFVTCAVFKGVHPTFPLDNSVAALSIPTTKPSTAVAFGTGTITKAGSTLVPSNYGTVEYWPLEGPFTSAWTTTGTGYATIALTGIPTSSNLLAYTGSWVYKPMQMWNGSAWVDKPTSRWNGTAWEPIS